MKLNQKYWMLIYSFGIVLAFLIGARLPSLWTATHWSFNFSYGSLRRSLVGTLFSPLWEVFSFNYYFYSAFAILITISLMLLAMMAGLKAKTFEIKILVMWWIFLPTGAYLFHQTGYFEQVVYILGFIAATLWGIFKGFISITLLSLVPFVHENSLLTVMPLVAVWLIFSKQSKELIKLLIPILVNLFLLFLPPLEDFKSDQIKINLQDRPFPISDLSIDVLTTTIKESQATYSIADALYESVPYGLMICFVWCVIIYKNRSTVNNSFVPTVVLILSSISPLFLIFGGSDRYRWIFLTLSNYVISIYIFFEKSNVRFYIPHFVMLSLPFFLLYYFPLNYFYGYIPRPPRIDLIWQALTAPRDFLLLAFRFPEM